MNFATFLQEKLVKQQELNLYRRHYPRYAHCFSSNDYLGLAQDPELIAHLQTGAQKYGVGSGASHLISGHQEIHEQLCAELADFLGYPRVILFSTGYMANLGIMQAILDSQAQVFHDQHNHASLFDGTLLAKARFSRYPHNDLSQLQQDLARSPAPRKLIVSEGVFSMDGDQSDLGALAGLAQSSGAWLLIDDAHGFGVQGERGIGSISGQQVRPEILMGTFGKALGVAGAFVATTELIAESLLQFARSYIYTTAFSPALAYACWQAVQMIQKDEWRRERLRANLAYFKQLALAAALPISFTETAIQPWIVGEAARALALQDYLAQHQIQVTAIRPPTVAAGSARLRISLSARHQPSEIENLVECLFEARKLWD